MVCRAGGQELLSAKHGGTLGGRGVISRDQRQQGANQKGLSPQWVQALQQHKGDAWLFLWERQAGCSTTALPWPCSKAGYPGAELAQPVPRPCYPSRLRPARLPPPAPSLPSAHGLLSQLSPGWLGGYSRGAAAASPSPALPLTLTAQLGLALGHLPHPCPSRPCQAGAGCSCCSSA